MNQNERYKERAENEFRWKSKSRDLYKAAIALWEDDSDEHFNPHFRSAMVLKGLCLENIVKFIIIKQGKTQMDNGKLDSKLRHHDLVKLFEEAEIKVEDSEEEKGFLYRIFNHVRWVGKYPVPLFANDLKKVTSGNDKTLVGSNRDLDRFKTVYKKTVSILESMN